FRRVLFRSRVHHACQSYMRNGWPRWNPSGTTQCASIQSTATNRVGKSTTYCPTGSGSTFRRAIDDPEAVTCRRASHGRLRRRLVALHVCLAGCDLPAVRSQTGNRQAQGVRLLPHQRAEIHRRAGQLKLSEVTHIQRNLDLLAQPLPLDCLRLRPQRGPQFSLALRLPAQWPRWRIARPALCWQNRPLAVALAVPAQRVWVRRRAGTDSRTSTWHL